MVLISKKEGDLVAIDNKRKFFFSLGFMHSSERVLNNWRQRGGKGGKDLPSRQAKTCLFVQSRRKEGRKSPLYRLNELWFQKAFSHVCTND